MSGFRSRNVWLGGKQNVADRGRRAVTTASRGCSMHPPVEWVCARCARMGDVVEFGEMESCCVRVEAGRINPVWA